MDALGVAALERRRNKIIDLCKVNWRENYCQAPFKSILAVELWSWGLSYSVHY